MTTTPEPEPIDPGLLPCAPPPGWEFHTVLGAPHGCMLLPGDQGPVVVRRRVTYGDWEPVRPDRWAPAVEGAAKPGENPAQMDNDQMDNPPVVELETSDPHEAGQAHGCPEECPVHNPGGPDVPAPAAPRCPVSNSGACLRTEDGDPECSGGCPFTRPPGVTLEISPCAGVRYDPGHGAHPWQPGADEYVWCPGGAADAAETAQCPREEPHSSHMWTWQEDGHRCPGRSERGPERAEQHTWVEAATGITWTRDHFGNAIPASDVLWQQYADAARTVLAGAGPRSVDEWAGLVADQILAVRDAELERLHAAITRAQAACHDLPPAGARRILDALTTQPDQEAPDA